MPPVPPRRSLRPLALVWVAAVGLLFAWHVWRDEGWRTARGYEFEWVARSLAAGHGFSFPSPKRWLFAPVAAPLTYHPTAWKEPVYPALLAAAYRTAGGRAPLAMILLQCLALVAAAGVLYRLGRRLHGPLLGLAAATLVLVPPTVRWAADATLDNTPFAMLLVPLVALAALRAREVPGARRGALLGLALGVAVLTHAGTELLLPVALAALLAAAAGDAARRRSLVRTALVAGAVAALVLLPWTVRNYRVFGALVPVRSGAGQILHFGYPVLAATLDPAVRPCAEPPPYVADDLAAALLRPRAGADRLALLHWQFRCIDRAPPAGYAGMNEVARDQVYAARAVAWIRAHPADAARLTAAKWAAFFVVGWPRGAQLVVALALAGVLFGARRFSVLLLGAFVLACSVPYALGFTFFERYRLPVVPLLQLLALYAVVGGAERVLRPAVRPAELPG